MNAPSYAERRRSAPLPLPRNMKAAREAQAQDLPLFVSFVGDIPWQNPTVYCDSGTRYAWDWMTAETRPRFPGDAPASKLNLVVVVRAGVKTFDALASILERSDVDGIGYPVLIDIEQKEVACVVHGAPVQLWQMRRGTPAWLHYFAP